jgi:hypothetical protein
MEKARIVARYVQDGLGNKTTFATKVIDRSQPHSADCQRKKQKKTNI